MIRLLLVEDHEIVARAFQRLLGDVPTVEVSAVAGDIASALAVLKEREVDVALVDVGLPDGSGVDLCREITRLYPHIRTVILSAYADSDTIYSAVEAGAAGFVAKGSGLDEVMRAIEAPREEPLVLEPELVLRLMQAVRARSDEFPRLSAREDELLGLLGEGLSNREIAERLSLSSGTVRNYVSALLRKLGVENRTQAALLADGARRDEGRGTI